MDDTNRLGVARLDARTNETPFRSGSRPQYGPNRPRGGNPPCIGCATKEAPRRKMGTNSAQTQDTIALGSAGDKRAGLISSDKREIRGARP